MAITVGSISSGQLSAYNADKPLFLAKNILASGTTNDVTTGSGPETSISAVWRSGSGKDVLNPDAMSGVGNTDLAQSPLRAFDYNLAGLTGPWLSPFGTAPGATFFCKGDESASFDSVVIANHNFKDIADYITEESPSARLFVEVYAGENNSFSSGTYQKLVRWEPGVTPGFSAFTKERLVCLDLGTSGAQTGGSPSGYQNKYYSYTGAVYFQVVIGVNDVSVTQLPAPLFGELFIGPRRQLSRNPTYDSWTDSPIINNIVAKFKSKTGTETRYGLSLGQSAYNPVWLPSGDSVQGTTDLYTLDDLGTLESFWEDTNYGANGFFLIPKPSSDPNTAPFCESMTSDFGAALQGGLTDRSITFDFQEIPPYVREET